MNLRLVSVVIYGICALVWSIKAFLEVVFLASPEGLFLLVLDVVCSLAWIIAFAVSLRRYLKHRYDQ